MWEGFYVIKSIGTRAMKYVITGASSAFDPNHHLLILLIIQPVFYSKTFVCLFNG